MFFESLPKFKALQLYQQEFMRAISQMAIADQRKNKICASLTVAQVILESRWGGSRHRFWLSSPNLSLSFTLKFATIEYRS